MDKKGIVQEERVEVKARIRKSLYESLVEECGHCGCTINGVVALAVSRELAKRRMDRKTIADAGILAGQISRRL